MHTALHITSSIIAIAAVAASLTHCIDRPKPARAIVRDHESVMSCACLDCTCLTCCAMTKLLELACLPRIAPARSTSEHCVVTTLPLASAKGIAQSVPLQAQCAYCKSDTRACYRVGCYSCCLCCVCIDCCLYSLLVRMQTHTRPTRTTQFATMYMPIICRRASSGPTCSRGDTCPYVHVEQPLTTTTTTYMSTASKHTTIEPVVSVNEPLKTQHTVFSHQHTMQATPALLVADRHGSKESIDTTTCEST